MYQMVVVSFTTQRFVTIIKHLTRLTSQSKVRFSNHTYELSLVLLWRKQTAQSSNCIFIKNKLAQSVFYGGIDTFKLYFRLQQQSYLDCMCPPGNQFYTCHLDKLLCQHYIEHCRGSDIPGSSCWFCRICQLHTLIAWK